MLTIRYVQETDKDFWFRLDKHLPEKEFVNKVQSKSGYVILLDDEPIGLLRYNLFWDLIPFCNLLLVDYAHHRKGYGKQLMEYWEADMKTQGYDRVLVSTQVDEGAQHFYRKIGYQDCGGFVLDVPGPMEVIMVKSL